MPSGRDELERLVDEHGIGTVAAWLRDIYTARRSKASRPRGRPTGPASDDTPLLCAAAAIWRQRGCGPVWKALLAVAGGSESTARRLLRRLNRATPADFGKFVDDGISDFAAAALRLSLARAMRCTSYTELRADDLDNWPTALLTSVRLLQDWFRDWLKLRDCHEALGVLLVLRELVAMATEDGVL